MKKNGLWVYLLITFVLTWGIFYAMYALQSPALNVVFLAAAMLMPALSSILTRLLIGEGFTDMKLKFGFRGNAIVYVLAWLLPSLLIAAGAALYFFLYRSHFDPSMSVMAQTLDEALPQALQGLLPVGLYAAVNLAAGVLLSPVLNIITCMGEELGWRGYLLPKLRMKMSNFWSVLISGVIWGVWHAPVIAMGHNYQTGYPGWPWLGIGAMILFCVFLGAFFSWLSIRTDSAWPAAIAHGAVNGFASAAILFVAPGIEPSPFVGPLPTGYIGGAFFVIAGVIFMIAVTRRPGLQPKEPPAPAE
ncbi:MAG: CPBP family intramembrane glutamic endopeptidase [Christensenellales bacterium]|jgi:membrane protease YdiL (CAAX protease family)